MIKMNIHDDIFKDCRSLTESGKECINKCVEHDTFCLYTHDAMGRLYELLKDYDELCQDYKNCRNDYTKKCMENELKSLRDKIFNYYVCELRKDEE